MTFLISTQSITEATEIHFSGEEWFKGMDIDLVDFKDFFKTKHGNTMVHMFQGVIDKIIITNYWKSFKGTSHVRGDLVRCITITLGY